MIIAAAVVVALIGSLFYFNHQVGFSHGSYTQNKIFKIVKGDGNTTVGKNLEKDGLISNDWYFYYYVRSHGLLSKLYPGEYLLSGNMTIPEIAAIITNPQKVYERVTFIEGWTAKQFAEELSSYGFGGDAFLALVKNPPAEIVSQFKVFSDKPKDAALEGYLFPDTYYFSKEATPEGILKKILQNTDTQLSTDISSIAKAQNKSLFQILIMASIIEKEVKTDADRVLVSGIFWNRIKIGQALQSDATLTYILGDKDAAHSGAQLATDSPYNSYQNKGLPPGPISNPGLASIIAAIHPQDSAYNYFLSDLKTGQTIFSKTYDEHLVNKAKYGL
ncbi:MAG: endolytic transglycosylase MltG [Parcubacteria group bacterium]